MNFLCFGFSKFDLVSDWRNSLWPEYRSQVPAFPSTIDKTVKSKLLHCESCSRMYRSKFTLWRHLKYECGKEPRFVCMFCPKKAFYKTEIWKHIRSKHCDYLPSTNLNSTDKIE